MVPIFKEQIARGGPVTVTHPDCTRYFMTIPEAVRPGAQAGPGRRRRALHPRHGRAHPDRATWPANLITSRATSGEDIPIAFTGLRPGEKLDEELLTDEEEQTHTVRNRIHAATSPAPPANLEAAIEALRKLADVGDREGILDLFRKIVPSFSVTPNGHSAPDAPAAEELEQERGADVVPLRVAGSRREERTA